MTNSVPIVHPSPANALYKARSSGKANAERICNVPLYVPVPPTPAMTLPTIKAFMVGAEPQTAQPMLNKAQAVQNTILLSNFVNDLALSSISQEL